MNMEISMATITAKIYSDLHAQYLRKCCMEKYMALLIDGYLDEYLLEFGNKARIEEDKIIRKYAEDEGITDALKDENETKWAQKMLNIKVRASEYILRTIIYA